jgi:hypothetical protein
MKLLKITIFISLSLLFASCGGGDKVKECLKLMEGVSQLGTVEYTITKLVKLDDNAFYTIGDRKILFSCRAYMKAGINLDEFTAENIEINKSANSVDITLPQPKILSLNMPLEEVKLEYESVGFFRSNFTVEDRNYFLKQGEEDILQDVENLGILTDARKNAEMFFKSLFAQLGFEIINVKFN